MSSKMTQNQAAAELGLGRNYSSDELKKAYKKTALAWSLERPCRPSSANQAVATFSRQILTQV